jgi:hypothetical protein
MWNLNNLTAFPTNSLKFFCIPAACKDREGSLAKKGWPKRDLKSTLYTRFVKRVSTGFPSASTLRRDFSKLSSHSEDAMESGPGVMTGSGRERGGDRRPREGDEGRFLWAVERSYGNN